MSDALQPNGQKQPAGPRALIRRDDLPQVLAAVRSLIRELAKRKLSPLLAVHEDASDLAQSVVLELMQNGTSLQFQGPAATNALARVVLVRLLSNKMRALRALKRDHGKEVHLPNEDESRPTQQLPQGVTTRDPAALAEVRELLEQGEQKMAMLSEREREAVRRRIAGQKHREIADELGISEALSQRLLSDARRKLRGE